MREDLKKTLIASFIEANKIEDANKKAQVKKQNAKTEFMNEFGRVRAEIIKPAMLEIGDFLVSHALQYEIDEQDEKYEGRTGKLLNRSEITISFFRGKKEWNGDRKHPHFSVYAESDSNKLIFRQSTIGPSRGGMSGGCGEANVNEINADKIQELIVALVKQII